MANITKRQHKDGSLAYTFKVYRGRDPETDKQLKPYVSTWTAPLTWSEKRADKEAEKQAVLFEQQCNSGNVAIDNQSFYDYSAYVLSLKASEGLKTNTIRIYNTSRDRVNKYIGHMKLRNISPAALNKMYQALLKEPNRLEPEKTLAPKTVLEDHRFVSAVFAIAVKEGIVPFNPAARANKPVVRRKTPVYYQQDDIVNIAAALESAPLKWKVYTHLLLVSGARRGEIGGLEWSRVDFEHNTILLSKAILYTKSRGIYEETTKEDNPHYVKLPVETMELLKVYRSWYNQEKLKQGDRWRDTDYVFVQEDGKPMHPSSITGWMYKFGKAHPELPYLNPHAFRHTQASLLYFAHVDPVTISHRLGHAQVSTTQNIYAHIIQEADERAAKCVADAIFSNTKAK